MFVLTKAWFIVAAGLLLLSFWKYLIVDSRPQLLPIVKQPDDKNCLRPEL